MITHGIIMTLRCVVVGCVMFMRLTLLNILNGNFFGKVNGVVGVHQLCAYMFETQNLLSQTWERDPPHKGLFSARPRGRGFFQGTLAMRGRGEERSCEWRV